jgi:hypothetical protein
VNRKRTTEKSIIDYVITNSNHNIITDLIIDEEGFIRPYSTKTTNGKSTNTETDHNTISMKVSTTIKNTIDKS